MDMIDFDVKKLESVRKKLWLVSGSLRGLSGLLKQGFRDPAFDGDEIFGLGQLLGKLSDELSGLDNMLSLYEENEKKE